MGGSASPALVAVKLRSSTFSAKNSSPWFISKSRLESSGVLRFFLFQPFGKCLVGLGQDTHIIGDLWSGDRPINMFAVVPFRPKNQAPCHYVLVSFGINVRSRVMTDTPLLRVQILRGNESIFVRVILLHHFNGLKIAATPDPTQDLFLGSVPLGCHQKNGLLSVVTMRPDVYSGDHNVTRTDLSNTGLRESVVFLPHQVVIEVDPIFVDRYGGSVEVKRTRTRYFPSGAECHCIPIICSAMLTFLAVSVIVQLKSIDGSTAATYQIQNDLLP